MPAENTSVAARKRWVREQAHAERCAQPDKDVLSEQILTRFVALPEFRRAATVMFYIDARSEVRTRDRLESALSDKRIVVPYCVDNDLQLFLLQKMNELSIGMYRILEPKPELRSLPDRIVDVTKLDLIMVPGVAFDRCGARIGHGNGYYDRLLANVRADTALVALAFECQLLDEIPIEEHDVFMDKIVTEERVYEGRGRTHLN